MIRHKKSRSAFQCPPPPNRGFNDEEDPPMACRRPQVRCKQQSGDSAQKAKGRGLQGLPEGPKRTCRAWLKRTSRSYFLEAIQQEAGHLGDRESGHDVVCVCVLLASPDLSSRSPGLRRSIKDRILDCTDLPSACAVTDHHRWSKYPE